MRITILFGGTNKERLVSVASAQSLCSALPEADLWFWDVDDTVHVEPRHTRQLRTGTDGYFGKVGRWLREGF